MTRRLLQHSFILLHVDHVELGERWNYKNVISPYYRMYYIDAGEGTISNGKKSWLLEPGYMYLIPSFTLCDLHCSNYLSQYFIHFFEEAHEGISLFHYDKNIFKIAASELDIANFKRIHEINPYRKINRSDNPKVYEKSVYYREYEELNNKQSNKAFLETQGIMMQLVSKFLTEDESKFKNGHEVSSKIVDLLGFIQLNLDKPLTVKMLSEKVNLHPDYLSRIFLKLTGERPQAYIHTKRIERAQYLIVTTDLSLTQIAEDTGFSSLPHFSKVFRSVTSLTPGKYREQNNLVTESQATAQTNSMEIE
jgi:AraC-like DNA-binding protein